MRTDNDMRGKLTNPRAVMAYALAGHATMTVASKVTGNRFTFKFDRPDPQDGQPPEARPMFVKVLSGTDNESDFTFLGTIWPNSGTWGYRRSPKSRVGDDAPSARAIRWIVGCLAAKPEALLEKAEVWHEGTCGRCGRKLTVPSSIESGFGPECIKHVQGDM